MSQRSQKGKELLSLPDWLLYKEYMCTGKKNSWSKRRSKRLLVSLPRIKTVNVLATYVLTFYLHVPTHTNVHKQSFKWKEDPIHSCTGKRLTAGQRRGYSWFPWCKCSHHGWFHTTNMMSTSLQDSWKFNNRLLGTSKPPSASPPLTKFCFPISHSPPLCSMKVLLHTLLKIVCIKLLLESKLFSFWNLEPDHGLFCRL